LAEPKTAQAHSRFHSVLADVQSIVFIQHGIAEYPPKTQFYLAVDQHTPRSVKKPRPYHSAPLFVGKDELFETDVIEDTDGRAQLVWKKVEAWRDWATLSEGCYLLRSNITDWSPDELWTAYIQLTDAEAAFRIHKTDLRIRPIWHQKEDRVLAHILVCFLAYVLWKTLAQKCQAAGLGDEPRRIFAELGKIRAVDVVLPTRTGIWIRKRCITRPTEHQAILLQRLGLELPATMKMTDM